MRKNYKKKDIIKMKHRINIVKKNLVWLILNNKNIGKRNDIIIKNKGLKKEIQKSMKIIKNQDN
jgi:hypothetical protein